MTAKTLDAAKFQDPLVTATGGRRAWVSLQALRTLWFNTGSLCNVSCPHCYMESSPSNHRLAPLTLDDLVPFLDEIARDRLPVSEIGFTGGEPFANRDLPDLLRECLARGFRVLVLTNGFGPFPKRREPLLALPARDRLTLRVSLDHYQRDRHEAERGPESFAPALDTLDWLTSHGVPTHVAGRTRGDESELGLREGYARLFAARALAIDAFDPVQLVLFPEMDAHADVPEITEACWSLLGKSPDGVMCASARMVVKRQGAASACVVACTLLPYDFRFEVGTTLAEAARPVSLTHPHCARFCVLGGARCSA